MKNRIISLLLISTFLTSFCLSGCGKSEEDVKQKLTVDNLFEHQKEIFSKNYLNNHQVNITGNMNVSVKSDLFALYAGMANEENSEVNLDTSEDNSKMEIAMKLNAEMTSKYSHENTTITTTICGVTETSDSEIYYDDEKLLKYEYDEDSDTWIYSKEEKPFLETFSFENIDNFSLPADDTEESTETDTKKSEDEITDFMNNLKKEFKDSDIKSDKNEKSVVIDKNINLVDFIGEDNVEDLTGTAHLILKFDEDDFDLNYISVDFDEDAKELIDKYLSAYGIHFEGLSIQLNLDWQDKVSVSIPKDIIDNAEEDEYMSEFTDIESNAEFNDSEEFDDCISYSSSKFNLYIMSASDILEKTGYSKDELLNTTISVPLENETKDVTAYDIAEAIADILTYCSDEDMDIYTASLGTSSSEAYAIGVDILHKNGIISDKAYETAKEYIHEEFNGVDMNSISKTVSDNKIDNIFEKIK